MVESSGADVLPPPPPELPVFSLLYVSIDGPVSQNFVASVTVSLSSTRNKTVVPTR